MEAKLEELIRPGEEMTLTWVQEALFTRERGTTWYGTLQSAASPALPPDRLKDTLIALSEPDALTRREAIFVLGELGGEAAVEALEEIAARAESEERLLAINALGKIGGPQAVEVLKQAVLKDSEEMVRAQAVLALGRLLDDSQAAESIRALLAHINHIDSSTYVSALAREALEQVEETAIEQP